MERRSAPMPAWRIILSPAGRDTCSIRATDEWRPADLLGQHRDGAMAAIDRAGHAECRTADASIPVVDAEFSKEGDPRYFWTERISALDEELALTWYGIGEPLLIHTQPNAEPNRPYGVCTVLIPALGARLTRNGVQAVGQAWAREREGRPFSTCALAFSESWTAAR